MGPLGYGRYNDSPDYVGCPHAFSDMTPCVARDGPVALADDAALGPSSVCVGCSKNPSDLLSELRREVTGRSGARVTTPRHAAAKLRDLVREVTEPPPPEKKVSGA